MTCKELKSQLKGLTISVLIFNYKEDTFLVNQYIAEIAKVNNLNVIYTSSLEACNTDASAFGADVKNLYVYKTETFDDVINPKDLHNTIIVCNKVGNKVGNNDIVVEFPKLEKWQLIDYIKTKCPGIDDSTADTLYSKSKGNPFRIDNELNKVSIFPEPQQVKLLTTLLNTEFKEYSTYNIFNLVSAITKKDMESLDAILKESKAIGVDAFALSAILRKNIKDMINVKSFPKAKADAFGMTDKQLIAVSYACKRYDIYTLANAYEFLTDFDYRIKSGMLDLSDSRLLDYLICEFMSRLIM